MQDQIDKIVTFSGIVAACLMDNDKTLLVAKSHASAVELGKWRQIFDGLTKVLDLAADPLKDSDSRTIIGDYSLTLIREGDCVIGTASMLGHPVAKSLRRMMKRVARRRGRSTRSNSESLQPSL
jgi:hypothetical protein